MAYSEEIFAASSFANEQSGIADYPSVGDSSLEVVQHIATTYDLEEVSLLRHTVGINWRQRYSDEEKAEYLDAGCFDHNDSKSTMEWAVDAQALGALTTNSLIEKSATDEVFSIGSRVKKAGEEFHIPMMNFHPEVADERQFIIDCVRQLQKQAPDLVPPGVLVESGRYFHYYGLGLIPTDKFDKYLASFLMPSVLVSPRYIGHSLHEAQCSLRVTHDQQFKPFLPKVVELIVP
jgi:hypothetical protein